MKNIVHLIGNMEFMEKCKDNQFDLSICDPPYGIGADKAQNNAAKQRIKSNGKSKAGRGYKLYKETEWDNKPPSKEYFQELFRISKNQIIWGGNYFIENLFSSMGWVVWNKCQREFSLADGELAWSSFDKALRIFDYSRGKALARNKNRFHPTQKPVALYKWLLKNYAKPGQTIFDSHVGSGSIRIACYDMGFDFEGCELDKDYWQAQEERYKNHIAQQSLFDTEEIQSLVFGEDHD